MKTHTLKFVVDGSGAEAGAKRTIVAIKSVKKAVADLEKSSAGAFSKITQAGGASPFQRMVANNTKSAQVQARLQLRAQKQFLTAERSAETLQKRLERLGDSKGIARLNASLRTLQRTTRGNVKSTDDLARAHLRFNRRLQTSRLSAIKSASSFDVLSKKMTATGGAIQRLKFFLSGYVSLLGITEISRAADQWTNLGNRLKIVTKGNKEFAQTQSAVLRLAKDTRSDLLATGSLVSRIAAGTKKPLGEVLGIVKTINEAVQIGGSTSSEAASVATQLSQALASSRLAGDELRSILENSPRLALAISTGLGTSIGKLRELGKAGELTTDRVIGALKKQASQIAAEYQKLAPSISASLTNLNTSFVEFIGRSSDASGAASKIAIAIQLAADNIGLLGGAIASILALGLVRWLGKVVAEVGGAVIAFGRWATSAGLLTQALKFIPQLRIASIIFGIGAAISSVSDQTLTWGDRTATVGELASVVWDRISSKSIEMFNTVSDVFAKLAQTYAPWIEAGRQALQTILGGFQAFAGAAFDTIKSMINRALNLFLAFGKSAKAVLVAIGRSLSGVINDALSGNFSGIGQRAGKVLTDQLSDGLRKAAKGNNRDLVGEFVDGVAKPVGTAISNEIDSIFKEAEERRKKIQEGTKPPQLQSDPFSSITNQTKPLLLPDNDNISEKIDKATDSTKRFTSALRAASNVSVEAKIATGGFSRDLIILQGLEDRGLITKMRSLELREKLNAAIKNAGDPMARELALKAQQEVLGKLTNDQRMKEIELRQAQANAIKMGTDLAAAEADAVTRAAGAHQQLNEQLESSSGPFQNWIDQAKNFNNELESILVKGLDGLADAFAEFVVTGKLDFKGLVDSMVRDLSRLAAQTALRQLFGGLTGGSAAGGGGLFGNFFSGGGGGIFAGLFKEGGISTNPASRTHANFNDFMGAPQFAQGTPNTSGGIPAVLHENEAVIPLSRNRKVPVELTGDNSNNSNSGGLTIHGPLLVVEAKDVDSFKRQENDVIGTATRLSDSIRRRNMR